MKRTLPLLILATTCVSAQANQTQKHVYVPPEWKARYKAVVKTLTSRDFTAWTAWLADDYIWVQPDGKKLNRTESIKEFQPYFKATKITGGEKITHIVQRMEHYYSNSPTLADVTFDAHWVFTMIGGKKIGYHEVGTDSWRKVKDKWLIYKTADTVAQEVPAK